MTSGSRVVVLDDDPTGTQSISGIPIVLQADAATIAQEAARTSGPLWILTNTRALHVTDAVTELTRITSLVRSTLGPDVQLVLRGDSTLRGHVLPEIDVLSGPGSVALFVPAFIEQGRLTLDSVHYSREHGERIPVAATEYAADATFGYTTSHLGDWVDQRDPGRRTVLIPIAKLRAGGATAVRDALLSSARGTVVIPDAETLDDIQAIHAGWLDACAAGRDVVLRCASTLAAVAVGSAPSPAPLDRVDAPVLVVCGSHTTGARAQLARVADRTDVRRVELSLSRPRSDEAERDVVAEVEASLASARVTVLSTPRDVPNEWHDIDSGQRVMDMLVDIVSILRRPLGALITKGGITSARVPRDGLGARSAWVLGQSSPGIPVWQLRRDGDPDLIQVVIPGNVGEADAIDQALDQLVGRSTRTSP